MYDARNRRTKATYADGAVASFTYDAAGRLVQADDTADPHRPITLAYDGLDRLVSEATALGVVSYQYVVLGRRTQMTVNDLNSVTYTYDAASRLRSITQAPLNPATIDYDALGRRTTLTLPNGVGTQYQYDAASRLTALIYRNAVAQIGDLSYTYDQAGNRTGVGGSFARTLLPDPVASATYDVANRQLTFGNKVMTYDANGSLASLTDPSGLTTFSWDARNRLTALTGPDATASFLYDAFGRRGSKQSSDSTSQYIYDELNIAQQADASGTTSYLRSLNIDEVFSITNRDGTYYSIYDPLGTTLAVTDQTGTPVVHYTYDPFGTTSSTNPAFPNPFQYSGRENDSLAGLYFCRARYYSPDLHRFLSEDVWGIAGREMNFYAYVANNPMSYVDPLGWWRVKVHERLTRDAADRLPGFFSPQDIDRLVEANRQVDTRHPFSWINPSDPNHYMLDTEARAQGIILEKFQEALQRDRAGDRAGALRALGQALHSTQDASAHALADPPGTIWRHVKGLLPFIPHPDSPRDNPTGFAQAQRDTEQLLRDFIRGRGVKGFR